MFMPNRKTLAAALLAAALSFAPRIADAQQWTAYTYLPSPNMNGVRALQAVAQDFEAASGGKIKVQVNVGGSLPIAGNSITQAVGDGIVHLADDGFFSGNVEMGGIVGLPMLFTSWEEYEKGLAILMPPLKKAFEQQGVVILGYYSWPVQVLWTSKKMTGLEDYQGLKIRPSSPEQAEFVRRFGGIPVSMSSSEVASALQTGVIDGAFTASVSGGRIWKEQLKYNYRLGLNYFPSLLTVNKEMFDALSPELQKALRDSAMKRGQEATDANLADEASATKELAAGGITVTEGSAADSAKGVETIKSYWDEWAKGRSKQTQAVLAEVRKALGR